MSHKHIPILRPGTRLSAIREQIDAIHHVLLPIGSWLLGACASNRDGEHEGWKNGQPIKGEAIVAAELLFCKACAKMEAVIDDPKFLSLADHDSAEKATLKMVEENTQLIRQQRIGLEWANSPAARYEPMLVRLEENFWSAVLGDLNNHSNMVVGVGPTPNDALQNFNDVFVGRASEPLMFYAEVRAKALAQKSDDVPPPIFGKDNEDNQPPHNPQI